MTQTAPAPDSASPHAPAPRSPLPDVLRGLSLLGILCVNMQDFAGYREWQQTGLDSVAQVITDVLANGRFISIFAMLFGWGAAGILARQGTVHFLRRHLALWLIGTLHFVLVWHGDIIATYAFLALSLLVAARLPLRGLLTAAGLLGGWWLLNLLGDAARFVQMRPFPRSDGLPDIGPHTTYAQMVLERWHGIPDDYLYGVLFNAPWLVALFCLGAAAQRTGLLTRPHEHQRVFRCLAVYGTGVGLLLGVTLAWLNTRADLVSGLLAIAIRMTGGLAGGLGYVGLVGLLLVHNRLGWLRHFAQSGRTAMSNYLAQSLTMTTLFYPYAGAQWGHWGAAAGLALALSFGLLQIWLSGLMVRAWGSGPMEKLVRWAVYRPKRSDEHLAG